MLKHFLIITSFISLVLVDLVSCGSSKAELERRAGIKNQIYDKEDTLESDSDDCITIKIIDSCEYIIYQQYIGGGMCSGICHKANCRNPIHKNTN